MRQFFLLFIFCFVCVILSANDTLWSLGAADLASNQPSDALKAQTQVSQLEAAFQVEAIEQLDLVYELDPPTDLELLQRENTQLTQRVSELERRLAKIEAKLSEVGLN